jgi:hypothetical protein
MRALLAFPLVLAFAASALAQPAGSDGHIVVAPQVCTAMAALAEAPGVAYTPGVDAEGHAVAPADLPGSPNVALSEFPIEITSDLRRRLNIPANAPLFRGIGRLGFVVVRGNEAYFNGQKLTPAEQEVISEACRQH